MPVVCDKCIDMKTHPYGNRFRDLTNQQFGRLTAKRVKEPIMRRAVWECLCHCGSITFVLGTGLTSGKTRSCGCLHREVAVTSNTTHGMRKSSEYVVWDGMRARCFRQSSPRYEKYGGRGITVCSRWMKFENFYADMGPRPSLKHQLNRINNDGNYEPGNCEWVPHQKQQRNTSRSRWLTFQERTLTMAEWADITGFSQDVIQQRLDKYHWPIERALTEPLRKVSRRKSSTLLLNLEH
jgi:hypothetical protein